MKDKLLYADRSKIHGRGCFAGVDLVPGVMIPVPTMAAIANSDYNLELEDRVVSLYTPFRFLNHSEVPNCEVQEWEETLYLCVTGVVRSGDELTINYNPE